MRVRLFHISLLAAVAVQAPTVASACRVGGDRILFTEAPSAYELRDARTVRMHFTNVGPLVERWRKLKPSDEVEGSLHGTLIGVGRLLDSERPDHFPIYGSVTSCTHGFWSMAFGRADPVWDGEYFLVGRFRADGSHRYFQAAGNWNGRWHY